MYPGIFKVARYIHIDMNVWAYNGVAFPLDAVKIFLLQLIAIVQ